MTIKRRMDRDGLVTTQVSGRVSLADVLDSVLELGELTAYSNELWEIILFDDSVEVARDHRTTLENAHGAKETVQFKTRGGIAIVASDPLVNSWGCKIAELLRGDAVPVTVFNDEAPARKWLSIHMEHSHFEATTIRSTKSLEPTRFRFDPRHSGL